MCIITSYTSCVHVPLLISDNASLLINPICVYVCVCANVCVNVCLSATLTLELRKLSVPELSTQ